MEHHNFNLKRLTRAMLLPSALAFTGAAVAADVTYEAEDQTWSQAVFEAQHAGFTGTGYVNTDNVAGSYIEFTVDVPSAGYYPMSMRYANGGSASRPVDITVNGEFKLPVLDFTSTSTWTNWSSLGFGLTLEAGSNTVRFIGSGSAGAPNIDSLIVTVADGENQAPVIVNQLQDMTLAQGGADIIIDLNDIFSDPDGDELSFDHDGSYNDSPNLVFTNNSPSEIAIRPIELGTERYDLIATDGSLDTSFSFYITVVAGNQAPVVANPIADFSDSRFGGSSFDLNSVFSDPNGDSLSYSVTSSNSAVTANINNGSTLSLIFQQAGASTITVSATDGEYTTETSFVVTVNPNQAPFVANPIGDIVMTLGDPTITIDMLEVFNDPDGDWLEYNYGTFTANYDWDITDVFISANEVGTTYHRIDASDSYNADVSVEFSVTVLDAGNNAPVVANPIADMVLNFQDPSFEIDLNTVFSDPDGDALSFQREASDDDSTVLHFKNGEPSVIVIDPHTTGTVSHLLIASDGNGGSVSFWFDLTVLPPAEYSVEMQAEDQSIGTNAVIESEHAGFTGTGYVNTVNAVGSDIEFTPYIPQAGNYTVTVTYANGSSNRNAEVRLNNVVNLASVDFANTGAWSSWAEQSFTLYFEEGDIDIRFEALTSGGLANIDKITVTSAD